jgi:lipopolysaccharide/colanic/teichoic acid biosynthesis glycosyltransferase
MLKRVFDVICALAALVVLSPVLLGLALSIKMSSPGPVCYRGVRVGLHGRPFRIFKFRSMVINADRIGGASTADGDPRITTIGRVLRKTKLDELPQLLNVLAGDMSFVGPRPEVQQYVDMYTEEEKAILTVRPGITDWASLWNPDEGAVLAGAADPERAYLELIRPQKLKWQLAYVRERSFLVDLSILARTFWTVVSRRTPPALMDTSAPPLSGVKRG